MKCAVEMIFFGWSSFSNQIGGTQSNCVGDPNQFKTVGIVHNNRTRRTGSSGSSGSSGRKIIKNSKLICAHFSVGIVDDFTSLNQ
jgi:hypothetical protein